MLFGGINYVRAAISLEHSYEERFNKKDLLFDLSPSKRIIDERLLWTGTIVENDKGVIWCIREVHELIGVGNSR